MSLTALKDLIKRSRSALMCFVFEALYGPRQKEWAVVCSPRAGLGDTHMISSLASSFLSIHRGDRFVIYAKESHRPIVESFPSARYKKLPRWFKPGVVQNPRFDRRIIYAIFPEEIIRALGYKGFNLMDAYKTLFKLPFDVTPATPRAGTAREIEDAAAFLQRHDLPEGRSAIIAPEANSSPGLDIAFVTTLAEKLRSEGFKIYIHSLKGMKIPETMTGAIPLGIFRHVTERAGMLISVRSGLCDILSGSKCKLIVLYPKVRWHFGTLYDETNLRSLGLSSTAHEIELDDDPKLAEKIANIALKSK